MRTNWNVDIGNDGNVKSTSNGCFRGIFPALIIFFCFECWYWNSYDICNKIKGFIELFWFTF